MCPLTAQFVEQLCHTHADLPVSPMSQSLSALFLPLPPKHTGVHRFGGCCSARQTVCHTGTGGTAGTGMQQWACKDGQDSCVVLLVLKLCKSCVVQHRTSLRILRARTPSAPFRPIDFGAPAATTCRCHRGKLSKSACRSDRDTLVTENAWCAAYSRCSSHGQQVFLVGGMQLVVALVSFGVPSALFAKVRATVVNAGCAGRLAIHTLDGVPLAQLRCRIVAVVMPGSCCPPPETVLAVRQGPFLPFPTTAAGSNTRPSSHSAALLVTNAHGGVTLSGCRSWHRSRQV